jgi:hypothetical protein
VRQEEMHKDLYKIKFAEYARQQEERARLQAKERTIQLKKSNEEKEKEELTAIRACTYDFEAFDSLELLIDEESFKLKLMQSVDVSDTFSGLKSIVE